jgi:hypothetical protein
MTDIKALDAAATQGVWFAGPLTTNDDDQRFISVGPYDLSDRPNNDHHYEDTILEVWDNPNNDGEPEANAALIVALVNAYRANQLVPVEAIGEALKMHLRNIGKRASWDEDEDQKQLRINCDKIAAHLELALAALTRMEARNG